LRVPGESGVLAQLKLLEFYDLVGAVKDQPTFKLDRIETANPDLAELMRNVGIRLYTPERNDTLVQSAELQGELSDTSASVIFSQWLDLIVEHPWEYVRVRGWVFAWVFLTPRIARCYPVYVGVSGLPKYMRDLRLVARMRPQDDWLRAYAMRFVGTPVYSHLTFMILGLMELAFLLRRGSPDDLGLAFLLGAALAFALSFFVISIACDYRYLIFLDLSVLVAGLYIANAGPQNGPNAHARSKADGRRGP
jgi:hypothetical protein